MESTYVEKEGGGDSMGDAVARVSGSGGSATADINTIANSYRSQDVSAG